MPRRFDAERRLSALIVGCAAVACGHKESDLATRPLEVVVATEVATLDPRFSTRSLDVQITRLVHAGLAGLDPDTLEPVPLVAERFTRDGPLALDVTLREGLRFHGGKPLAPEDVCATLEAVRDRALHSPHRAVVASIAHCTETGPRSLRLTLSAPRATLLSDLEIPILRADEARSPPHPDGTLDGLGPFRVAKLEEGAVHLAAATTGVVPTPRHDVVFRTVRDENARVQRLLAGRSDVAENAVSPALVPALDGVSSLSVVARPGANVTYLLFDEDRPPFDRVDVRRAIFQSIDRELVARTLLGGHAEPAASFLPSGHWAEVAIPPPPFSPTTARPILSSLSPITLLSSTDRSRLTIARAVAQMIGDAGLPVRVVSLDLGVLLSRLDAGDFDIALLQIPELTEPNVLSWFFHPRGIPGEGGEGKNRGRYRNAAAGELLDRASESSDRDERKARYAEFQALMARDLPAIPLWHEDQVAVLSTRARGFRPSAEGRFASLARLE